MANLSYPLIDIEFGYVIGEYIYKGKYKFRKILNLIGKGIFFFVVFIILLLTIYSWSQSDKENILDRFKPISISTNVAKPFLGLVNSEIEYQISSNLSVQIYTEYLYKNTEYLNKIDHPDFIILMGCRYYPLSKKINVSGLYGGINLGYIVSKNNSEYRVFAVQGELGYKLLFKNIFFIRPKGLITYPIGGNKILPGLEVLEGLMF